VSGVLFRRTWAAQRVRLLVVMLALAAWGFLLPVVYATFGKEVEALARSSTFANVFDILSRYTGGNVFSVQGTVALGLVHPIALALVAIQVVGFAAAAVAGERQRGTLEVLLARPLERRVLYATLLAATLLFTALTEAAVLGGIVAGALLFGVAGDLRAIDIALCWLNAVALFGALGAISLAASVSFDRLGPAMGIAVGVTIVGYAAEFLGTLWPDAAWLRVASPFRYFQPTRILAGTFEPRDLLVLGAVFAAAVTWAVWVFPRRDLAAPS
jgi:ABC-type transport system involved in multi-copper enzyme maturation permease subunit